MHIHCVNQCKLILKVLKKFLFFQDLELLINLIGSKYIKMHQFEGEKFSLISSRSPSLVNTKTK
jgi:hypothetical protein